MAACFVVQGFGKKTDFTDGRVLDLDASYAIIKQAVLDAGLQCIRADEIQHAGSIDVPMYQQLLQADLVIADLSTYNVNAAFELGVRYGLRPCATIIVAEEGFKNPFDVGHIVIRRYKHLGEDIGAKEAKRFGDDLKKAIGEILAKGETDSPVYTFLPELTPPRVKASTTAAAPPSAAPPSAAPPSAAPPSAAPPSAAPPPAAPAVPAPTAAVLARGMSFSIEASADGGDQAGALLNAPNAPAASATPEVQDAPGAPGAPAAQSAKANLEQALAKLQAGDFGAACGLLQAVRKQRPNDSFVIQQLALATYKSKQPSPEDALNDAKNILQTLNPASTNDPETLGLWGAIHKRLWEIKRLDADLSESIDAYGRGFRLKQDYYNGINLAYLLELRALTALKAGEREEGITDSTLARRIRRDVIRYTLPLVDKDYGDEQRYWILATLWEAAAGIGDIAAAENWAAQARALKMADWMSETSEKQIQSMLTMQLEIAQLGRQPPSP